MTHYVYTTIAGVFLFNQNFKLVDKFLFNKKDIFKINQELKAGLWLKQELALLEKFKDAVFVGFKETHQHYCQWNLDIVSKLNTELELYDDNLYLTKQEIRASVTDDLLIIQTVSCLEEVKKAINLLSKRLREWYEYYCPEYSNKVADNERFAELIISKQRSELMVELELKETMGGDLSKENLDAVLDLAKQITQLSKFKERETIYLESLMKKTCPNLYALAGSLIGAKLIMHSGSLHRLALFPSSTIQLLGAEKALFRHIKSGNKCPKYGVLLQHPLVAKSQDKGKLARVLANKIAIAVKCDVNGTTGYGEQERKSLESKFGK